MCDEFFVTDVTKVYFYADNQIKFRYAAVFLTKLLDLEFKFFADM